MWKQSTFFGFVAGALITLSLQALTAIGLFNLPKSIGSAALSSGSTTALNSLPQNSPPPPLDFDFGEHLTFAPFILVSAGLFFMAGALYFALSSTSAKFENEISELTSSSMKANEKQEIEQAVYGQFRGRLLAYFGFGTLAGVLGIFALLFRA